LGAAWKTAAPFLFGSLVFYIYDINNDDIDSFLIPE